jgi:hypothetical protein
VTDPRDEAISAITSISKILRDRARWRDRIKLDEHRRITICESLSPEARAIVNEAFPEAFDGLVPG